MRNFARFLVGLFLTAVVLVCAWLGWALWPTRPTLPAEVRVPGLARPVTVDTSGQGFVTVQGRDFLDALSGLGYAHGRDRFWTMDLARRRAAGRLAEVLGKSALEADKAARLHDFSHQAEKVLARLPEEQKAQLAAYTMGVNAALREAGGTTWGHRLHGVTAEVWTEQDCILVMDTLFLELQEGSWEREARAAEVRDRLNLAWVDALLSPEGGGGKALPGPKSLDLQRLTRTGSEEEPVSLKEEAAELLARLHAPLPLQGEPVYSPEKIGTRWLLPAELPSLFYPTRLQYSRGEDPVDVLGLTRPGLPIFWFGSTNHLRWAVAPLALNNADLVILPYSDIDPETYYAAGTSIKKIEERTETIVVRGEKPVTVTVKLSPWGPLVARGEKNQHLALRWAAHDPEALDFAFASLPEAEDLEGASELVRGAALPPLLATVVDRNGGGITTETGLRPARRNMDGSVPLPWAYGDRGWNGWVAAAEIPLQPAVAPVPPTDQTPFWIETLRRMAAENVPASHSARWSDLRKALALAPAGSPEAEAFARAFARRVTARALAPILRRVANKYPDFHYGYFRTEPLVLRLLTERPAHALDPRYTSWDDLLLNAADDVLEDLPATLSAVHDRLHFVPAGVTGWRAWTLRPWSLAGAARATDHPEQAWTTIELGVDQLQLSAPGGRVDHPLSPAFHDYHPAWQAARTVEFGRGENPGARTILQP